MRGCSNWCFVIAFARHGQFLNPLPNPRQQERGRNVIHVILASMLLLGRLILFSNRIAN